MHHIHALPAEARRGHRIPRNCNYGWFPATPWVLGTKTQSFTRASSALNFWAIFPAPKVHYFSSSTKMNSTCTKGLKTIPKTLRLLEEKERSKPTSGYRLRRSLSIGSWLGSKLDQQPTWGLMKLKFPVLWDQPLTSWRDSLENGKENLCQLYVGQAVNMWNVK